MNKFALDNDFLAMCRFISRHKDKGHLIYWLEIFIDSSIYPPTITSYPPQYCHTWRIESFSIAVASDLIAKDTLEDMEEAIKLIPHIVDLMNSDIESTKILRSINSIDEHVVKKNKAPNSSNGIIGIFSYILETTPEHFDSHVSSLIEKNSISTAIAAKNQDALFVNLPVNKL